MRWVDVLTVWHYPKTVELAPILEELGLDPAKYSYPWELARDLRTLIDEKIKMIYVRGEWRPLALYDPIVDFFKWLWEQLKKLLEPYKDFIIAIAIGGLITWLVPGWYKVLGVIPIIVGIYSLLKGLGVIE